MLNELLKAVNENGVITVIIVVAILGVIAVGKSLLPLWSKKITKIIEEDGVLESTIHKKYFDLVQETIDDNKATNKRLLNDLSKITRTNEELSRTNTMLIESFDGRLGTLEETVNQINKKIK